MKFLWAWSTHSWARHDQCQDRERQPSWKSLPLPWRSPAGLASPSGLKAGHVTALNTPPTPAPASTTPFQKIIKFHATESKEYRLSFFSLKNNLYLRETSFGFCFILVSWKFTMHFPLLWCLCVLNNQSDLWCMSGVFPYFLYHPEFFKGSIWIFHIFSSLWGLTYNKFSPTHTQIGKWKNE